MRYPGSEKLEIIRLVERSHLPVRRTLATLGILPITFYGGMRACMQAGPRRWKTNRLGPSGCGKRSRRRAAVRSSNRGWGGGDRSRRRGGRRGGGGGAPLMERIFLGGGPGFLGAKSRSTEPPPPPSSS